MMIREQIELRHRRMAQRLDKENDPEDLSQPMMRGPNPHFELSGRTVGTAYGGIGLIHQFFKELEQINGIRTKQSGQGAPAQAGGK